MARTGVDLPEQRRRMLIASTLIMVTIGGGILTAASEHVAHWRSVDILKLSGLMVLAFVLALRSTTAIRLRPRNPVLDDELTRANRASAAGWGFWFLMTALLALFVANFYWPMTLQEVAPIVIVYGAAAAGLRFAFLERRGARD